MEAADLPVTTVLVNQTAGARDFAEVLPQAYSAALRR
jgi:hypothetical protein